MNEMTVWCQSQSKCRRRCSAVVVVVVANVPFVENVYNGFFIFPT